MVSSVLLPAAMNAGGQLLNAGVNAVGQALGNKFGANQGQTSIGDAQKVVDYIKSNGLQIDPQHEAALQEAAARDNAGFQQGMQRSDVLFGAGVGNQRANLDTARNAALNAQTNAANLATQSMQNAANRAMQNSQMIQGAIQAGMNAR